MGICKRTRDNITDNERISACYTGLEAKYVYDLSPLVGFDIFDV